QLAIHQTAYIARIIHWDRIMHLLSKPNKLFETTYRWGADDFQYSTFIEWLRELLISLKSPADYYYPTSGILNALNPTMTDLEESSAMKLRIPIYKSIDSTSDIGLEIYPLFKGDISIVEGITFIGYLSGSLSSEFHISDTLKLLVEGANGFETGFGVLMRARNPISLLSDLYSNDGTNYIQQTSGYFRIKLSYQDEDVPSTLLVGSSDGSRFEIQNLACAIGFYFAEENELCIELKITSARLVISVKNGDGFLQKILPEGGIDSNFDLTIGYSTLRGVYFSGSGALDITIPINKAIGPINLESVYLAIKFPETGKNFPVILAFSANAKIGPISATIKNIGMQININLLDDGSKLSLNNMKLGFKWPEGVGLAINTSGLTGGGYLEFDSDNERYAGILQLNFQKIGLVAIGLITTRMPDGSKGFSMLLSINVTFDPAITLPYNFYLHGVGGLIGINRTMKIDVIRQGLKTGILDSILFPQDPIQNASRIISDLRAVFPPAEGRYVIAPMVMLSWSKIVFADLGLFIELPSPVKIVLLGQLYTQLPSKEDPKVEIHLDVLGVLDLDKKMLSFDAALYDSRITKFTLSGEAAFRLSWGTKPSFALSIGGWHPKFKDLPPGFPKLKRLTLSLGSGNNPRINLESYLALTSATFQTGAKLEVYAKKAGFKVQGYLGFDTLIIFSPFSFDADFGGGVSVKKGSKTLMSVDLDLSLSGPNPWHAKGKAKFKILFVKVKVRIDATWGNRNKAQLPPVDPWPELETELNDPRNWSGALPPGARMAVSLREQEENTGGVIVHPRGVLEIRQKVVPLGIKLSKFRNAIPPENSNKFEIAYASIAGGEELNRSPVEDYFARASYEDMSNSEKLSTPSFEEMESGAAIGSSAIDYSSPISYDLEYETEVIDENKVSEKISRPAVPWLFSKHLLKGGAAAISPIIKNGPDKYKVMGKSPLVNLQKNGFSVVSTRDMAMVAPNIVPGNGETTFAQASQNLENYLAAHPEQRDELQIVPNCEVYQ
ncbi:MAG: DUF6603 domain-containing protein, partial [Candidatus Odinarchaeota archaeon]